MSLNFNSTVAPQYIKNKQQNNDNFGALSQENQQRLQTAETAITQTAKDSWFASLLKGLGIKDPKKAAISALGAIAIVFGLSGLFNRAIRKNGIYKLGNSIDNGMKSIANSPFGKNITAWSKKNLSPIKNKFSDSGISKFFKSQKQWLTDLKKNRLNFAPTNSFAKPILRGTNGEALDTITDALKAMDMDDKVTDILKTSIKNTDVDIDPTDILKQIKKLNGGDASKITTEQIQLVLSNNKLGRNPQLAQKILPLTQESNKLRSFLSDLTGVEVKSAKMDDFITKIRKIKVDDYSKYDTFEEIYKEIIENSNLKTNGKLDPKKLNDFLDTFNSKIQQTDAGGFGFAAAQKVNMGDALKKYAVLRGHGAESKLGQFVQKILLRTTEGITNGVTSRAAMGLLMGFGIYYGVMNKTQEAPEGKKVATLADNAVGDAGGYMLIPVAGGLTYSAANYKYAGSSVKNIKKFKIDGFKVNGEHVKSLKQIQEALEDAVKKAPKGFAGRSARKQARKTAKQSYKKLLKVFNQDVKWYLKPFRKLMSTLSIGLEKIPGKRFLKTRARGFGGGALRFVIIGMGLTGLLVKPIMALCHKIFGKPPEEENDKDKNKEIKDDNAAITNNNTVQATSTETKQTSNYIDMLTKQTEQQPAQSIKQKDLQVNSTPTSIASQSINSNEQEQPIPNEEEVIGSNRIKENTQNPTRRYVPSSEPTQFNDEGEIDSEVAALLNKAESMENNIYKKLK